MFATVVLVFFGLSFGAFGVWALAAPQSLSQLLHFGLETPGAVTELRAFYGGLELGLCGFLLAAVFFRHLVPGALIALAAIAGGVALGRIIGMVLDGSTSSLMLGVLTWEIAGAVLGVAAYLTLPDANV
ncbi:MAG: DUF4345 family protein [Pseudomonadota bacterium]